MTKIEELQKLIAESGKELSDRIEFQNDGGRDIIIVVDNEAEYSDEAIIFESYRPYETLEFLEGEGFLKIKDQGFGVIAFEGKEFALTQQAYIDGPADGTPIYKASAVDHEGDEYEVTWNVHENWEEIEDESEMCDWENPSEVTAI